MNRYPATNDENVDIRSTYMCSKNREIKDILRNHTAG